MTIQRKITILTVEKGRKKITKEKSRPLPEVRAKPNRGIETLSFALVFESWLENGTATDYSDISRITGISRFMVTRMMSQLLLPPREQEAILKKLN